MERLVRGRRGMELAVNTLVVLILGLIIVGSGIALIYGIFDKAKAMPEQVSHALESQLFDILLSSNDRVATLQNVKAGARKEMLIFPVAVSNQLEGVQATFKAVKAIKAQTAPTGSNCDSSSPPPSCPTMELIDEPFTLKRYDRKAFPVGIQIPKDAVAGQYTYRLNITNITGSSSSFYADLDLNIVVK